jgi:hypothetical protein
MALKSSSNAVFVDAMLAMRVGANRSWLKSVRYPRKEVAAVHLGPYARCPENVKE